MTQTERYEIKDRRSGEVRFTGEISVTPDMLPSVKLGLAVKSAVKSGADLSGADLSGAYLRGAYLSGTDLSGTYLRGTDLRGTDLSGTYLSGEKVARLLARATRNDGYEFFAFAMEVGGVKIVAGCRRFTPAEFCAHVAAEYPDTDKAVETLSIIEHIERMAGLFQSTPVAVETQAVAA